MRRLIKGGHLIDPGRFDGRFDILIVDGKVADIRPDIPEDDTDEVLRVDGHIVSPGLIDLHVHFREPGQEYKETIESGCRAAAKGGFTAVCPMPNTNPVNDSPEITTFMIDRAKKANGVRVLPVAAASRGSRGEQLCEYGELKNAGAVAVSDDGMPVANSRMMRRALEYAAGFGLPVISHSEEMSLSAGGSMNEGAVATRMGLGGIPNAAESIAVMRDIALGELTGAPLHLAHISTRESLDAIRHAKARGIPVTAETAPHYFTLTDAAVEGYRTHAKMNPPLRSETDRLAIIAALADGTLDAIATDHAPHEPLSKEVEFDRAANGIIGLETSLPLSLQLVRDGVLTMVGLIERMSLNPARIIGLPVGLAPGNPADITVIDPNHTFTLKADGLESLSRNTPFDGWELTGRAVLTMVGGRVVYRTGTSAPAS